MPGSCKSLFLGVNEMSEMASEQPYGAVLSMWSQI